MILRFIRKKKKQSITVKQNQSTFQNDFHIKKSTDRIHLCDMCKNYCRNLNERREFTPTHKKQFKKAPPPEFDDNRGTIVAKKFLSTLTRKYSTE